MPAFFVSESFCTALVRDSIHDALGDRLTDIKYGKKLEDLHSGGVPRPLVSDAINARIGPWGHGVTSAQAEAWVYVGDAVNDVYAQLK